MRSRLRSIVAIVALLASSPAFAEFLWADSLPKLLQARLIDSFENYDMAHAPLRSADFGSQADNQLLLDIRRFRIDTEGGNAADIALSARLVDKGGKVLASRLFEQKQPVERLEPAPAVAAFNEAFGRMARELIVWTLQLL